MEEMLYLYPEKDSKYRTLHNLRDPCKVPNLYSSEVKMPQTAQVGGDEEPALP